MSRARPPPSSQPQVGAEEPRRARLLSRASPGRPTYRRRAPDGQEEQQQQQPPPRAGPHVGGGAGGAERGERSAASGAGRVPQPLRAAGEAPAARRRRPHPAPRAGTRRLKRQAPPRRGGSGHGGDGDDDDDNDNNNSGEDGDGGDEAGKGLCPSSPSALPDPSVCPDKKLACPNCGGPRCVRGEEPQSSQRWCRGSRRCSRLLVMPSDVGCGLVPAVLLRVGFGDVLCPFQLTFVIF